MAEHERCDADHAMFDASWSAAWSLIGLKPCHGLKTELLRAWSEQHRRYHDLNHLSECLALLAQWQDLAVRLGEVTLALWFHDAVYDPQSTEPGSNELASAAWAARSLVKAGASSALAQQVYDLVAATRHDAPSALTQSADAALLLDIDLSVLGSAPARYERYRLDVREEYRWLSDHRYAQGRSNVLQGFLDRPHIYSTPRARNALEIQARINLRTERLQLVAC